MKDLFKTIMPLDKLHKNYKSVYDSQGHEAARKIINEVYNSFDPIDADFIQQFQSTGFDARIWELYLAATFQEQNFEILRTHDRPDFELKKGNNKIFVEAVTANPIHNQPILDKIQILSNLKEEDYGKFMYQLRNESTVRIAGALFNKLQYEYWNLKWVEGYPLILAVEDFHHSLSHMLSDSNISGYLYGIDNTWSYDTDGKLNVHTHELKEHKSDTKSIPSNFFNLKNSEYISAVIFSNSGTISKFNRMGKLKGYGAPNVTMIRSGLKYNLDPNATHPLPFYYTVGQKGSEEDWAQGISMFHNPKAKYPLDRNLFPGILHGYYDKHFYAYFPDFFPIHSETQIRIEC